MKTQEIQKLYSEYILPTYTQAPVCIVKGKGSRVWDIQGKDYLDFFPGWAVSGLGHCYPDVVNAIKEQAKKLIHLPNNFLNAKQAFLAREISKASFPGRIFFCNSGAEAVDTAIKFARKYGSESGRYEIISMKQSFHGRSFGGIAATGQEKIRKGFAPDLQGFRYAEFNDLLSVASLVTDKTIAIFLEPVQGEGGVHVATHEFMKGLRKICDERNLLLIVDEIQTGMGRTGKMFAYQHYGIEPDLMTLAKALGGGVPIGALIAHNKIKKEVLGPGTHGSTFGGNPLVAAAALAVFKVIRKKRLIQATQELGKYFGEELEKLKEKFPTLIREIRGLALMRGVQLLVPGAPIVEAAREKGLIINCTQDTVLRIFPAMTVKKSELNQAVQILDEVLEKISQKK